jgi:quinol monooxygenase YgiN
MKRQTTRSRNHGSFAESTLIALALALSLTLLLSACSDDDVEPPPTPDSGLADSSAADSAPLPDAALPDTVVASDGAGPPPLWAVLIRGELAADLNSSKTSHDALSKGGEAAAKAAGDIAHDALLGTKLLGTTEDAFLGLDLWKDLKGMQTFYADPNFAKAFAALFKAPPPQPELFVYQPTWHNWGSMTSGDAHAPYYFVVARGRLKATDPKLAQQAHDQVAAAGETAVKAAGDVAHVVFTGLTDPREFLAIDIWKDNTNLAGVYSDPNFVKGFAALFEVAPTVQVYRSTDWYQW